MSSGFYTTYLGLKAREDAIDVVANNIANATTTGFKADGAFFEAFQQALEKEAQGIETTPAELSVQLQAVKIDFTAGSLRRTDGELDVALQGDGFFVVQTAAGERYTRNGSFTLDADGQLVTLQGQVVMGTGGPLTISGNQVTIDEAGNVSVDNQVVGTLRVVRFDNKETLRKEGGNLLIQSDPNNLPQPSANTRVLQGHLEQSNVNSLREMTQMMKLMREFESLQKMLTTMSSELSTTQMGRINP